MQQAEGVTISASVRDGEETRKFSVSGETFEAAIVALMRALTAPKVPIAGTST